MITTALLATMILSAPPTEAPEVWEGKLYVEFVEAHPRQRKVKRSGDVMPATLRIVKTGTSFTGEWIEGDRSLAIAGTIKRGQFQAVPTRVLKGTWNQDILNDLRITGSFNQREMRGQLYGAGAKRVRGGQFVMQKKL